MGAGVLFFSFPDAFLRPPIKRDSDSPIPCGRTSRDLGGANNTPKDAVDHLHAEY